jgi:dipeptide/tripeptide permease
LAYNLIGAAPGPFMTGVLADKVGLLGALQLAQLVSIPAAMAFALCRRTYLRDLPDAAR